MTTRRALLALTIVALALWESWARAELTTWDGKHAIDKVEVTVVYFVPCDRTPLAQPP